jgi:serine/threonine protein kinase
MPDPQPEPAIPRTIDYTQSGLSTAQVLLGRYEIKRVLGRGAMGEVLEVYDRHSGNNYAMKRVPPHLVSDTTQMRNIRDNFALVSQLAHPHIGTTRQLEIDPATGHALIIMDLIRGKDLANWLATKRTSLGDAQAPLPMNLVLGIAEQIASALDYAHSQPVSRGADGKPSQFGILHRDLKPANVMVEDGREFRPGVPYIKLVDFGLAAEIQASLQSLSVTRDMKLSGTPVYMAPEQWQGRTRTRGVDQWSLAVMIYEMLAGRRPFDAPNNTALMLQIIKPDPEQPSTINDAQWSVLKRTFQSDRKLRHPSCMDLVKSLAVAHKATADLVVSSTLIMPPLEVEDDVSKKNKAIPPPLPIEKKRPKWVGVVAVALLVLVFWFWRPGPTPVPPPQPAAETLVDPAVVGEWLISGTNKMGAWTLDWNLQPSGRYFTSSSGPGAATSESGTFETRNGTFTVNADSGRIDQGTYYLVDADTLVLVSNSIPATWRRASVVRSNSQPLPPTVPPPAIPRHVTPSPAPTPAPAAPPPAPVSPSPALVSDGALTPVFPKRTDGIGDDSKFRSALAEWNSILDRSANHPSAATLRTKLNNIKGTADAYISRRKSYEYDAAEYNYEVANPSESDRERMIRLNGMLPKISQNDLIKSKNETDGLYQKLCELVGDFVQSLKVLK